MTWTTPSVSDLVRDVALAQEARADVLHARELGVEDLQRDLAAIPMRRGVDRRHTADPEEGLEPVFRIHGRSDARVQAREDLVAAHREPSIAT